MTRAFPLGDEIPIVSTCFQRAWASIEDGVLFSKDTLCAHCVPGTQDSPQLPISFHSTENRFGLIITESQDIGLSGSFSFIVASTPKLRNRVSSYLRLREKRIQYWGIFINISWDIISTKQRAFDQPFFRLRSSQENLIRWGTIDYVENYWWEYSFQNAICGVSCSNLTNNEFVRLTDRSKLSRTILGFESFVNKRYLEY